MSTMMMMMMTTEVLISLFFLFSIFSMFCDNDKTDGGRLDKIHWKREVFPFSEKESNFHFKRKFCHLKKQYKNNILLCVIVWYFYKMILNQRIISIICKKMSCSIIFWASSIKWKLKKCQKGNLEWKQNWIFTELNNHFKFDNFKYFKSRLI